MKAANNMRAPLGDAVTWIRDIAANCGELDITWYVGDQPVATASYTRNRVIDPGLHKEIARTNPTVTRVELVEGGATHVFTVFDGEPPEDVE